MHTLGALAVTELNILTRTRKRVTRRAILPEQVSKVKKISIET